MSVVISLSSIPSRFSQIGIVLERLLAQDIQKFRVELYIPGKGGQVLGKRSSVTIGIACDLRLII